MKALNLKLLRELWHMKGQVFAITLVVTSAWPPSFMFISTINSLDFTRTKFYRDYNFADVFVDLKRAPESLKDKLKNINGVNQLETRVCAQAKLDIKGFTESVTGKIISIPDDGNPLINRLYIRKGRLPDPVRDDEVVINETFAQAHSLNPGDQFAAVINGKWKKLTITGIALSPEFVLLMKAGAMSPDFKRYGALWMTRKAISKAYDMDGAFNDVVLTLYPGTQLSDVTRDLDNVLEKYGGFGAYGRKDQISHRLLSEEFRQLKTSAKIFPTIFICVAAFLLNVVMSRTINTQREQIAHAQSFRLQQSEYCRSLRASGRSDYCHRNFMRHRRRYLVREDAGRHLYVHLSFPVFYLQITSVGDYRGRFYQRCFRSGRNRAFSLEGIQNSRPRKQ